MALSIGTASRNAATNAYLRKHDNAEGILAASRETKRRFSYASAFTAAALS